MKRHTTHQIDELAQRVLKNALPPSWVCNPHQIDYGKDYLVETADGQDDLTGDSFFIQLKGKQRPCTSSDGLTIKLSLERKHAAYYLDKIKDLPVFLVIVDVVRQKGWWLFLQPCLHGDQAWRHRGSVTLRVPSANNICDIAGLRAAVEESKRWMRLHHPTAIRESLIAEKEKIVRIDRRFDAVASLVNDELRFELRAKEPVDLTFEFTGKEEAIRKKLDDLLGKGASVQFLPGEVSVTGSKLFESIQRVGCTLQASLNLPAALTLVCRDSSGTELARLTDIPGRFKGGTKEVWFEGGYANSPFTIRLGPISSEVGGSIQFHFNFHHWDGQRLTRLGYFDRLHDYVRAFPGSAATFIEFQQDGNDLFSVSVPVNGTRFPETLPDYFDSLRKARAIATRFNVNPIWTVSAFGPDDQADVNELYDILFGSGVSRPMPNVRMSARLERKSFRSDVAAKAIGPRFMRITEDCTYSFFDETIEVGCLAYDYTEMLLEIEGDTQCLGHSGTGTQTAETPPRISEEQGVKVVLVGSQNTVRTIRAILPED